MKSDPTALRPTQLCVGRQQVGDKAARLSKLKKSGGLHAYLRDHPVPVVLGPHGDMFVTDHHHLCCAMLEAGVPLQEARLEVVQDWKALAEPDFWSLMEQHGYVWRHDKKGGELDRDAFVRSLPRRMADMSDDPYRSLAALVRKRGAYTKDWTPFAEFQWANWLRTRVGPTDVEGAVVLARSEAAGSLPGYISAGRQ